MNRSDVDTLISQVLETYDGTFESWNSIAELMLSAFDRATIKARVVERHERRIA